MNSARFPRIYASMLILLLFVSTISKASEPASRIVLDLEHVPLAVGYGGGWVWDRGQQRIERIDLATGESGDEYVTLPFEPYAASVEDEALWVIDTERSQLTRVDVNTFEIAAVIDVDAYFEAWEFVAVVTGDGHVWLKGETTMLRIDPKTNRVWGEPIPAGEEILVAAVYGDELWVGSHDDGLISRVDLATHDITAQFDLGFSVHGLAAGEESAWVLDEHGFVVIEVDLATNAPKAKLPIDFVGANIAISAGSLWIAPALYDGGVHTDFDAVRRFDLQGRYWNDIPIGNLNTSEYFLLQVEDGDVWLITYGSSGQPSTLVRLADG